jgi:hypothetical protein
MATAYFPLRPYLLFHDLLRTVELLRTRDTLTGPKQVNDCRCPRISQESGPHHLPAFVRDYYITCILLGAINVISGKAICCSRGRISPAGRLCFSAASDLGPAEKYDW